MPRPRPVGRGLGKDCVACCRLGSVLVQGGDCRHVREPVGLVLDGDGDLAQPVGVLVPVVAAEEQFRAGTEDGTDVGLRATTVATVQGGQFTCIDGRGHVGTSSLYRVLPYVSAGNAE